MKGGREGRERGGEREGEGKRKREREGRGERGNQNLVWKF